MRVQLFLSRSHLEPGRSQLRASEGPSLGRSAEASRLQACGWRGKTPHTGWQENALTPSFATGYQVNLGTWTLPSQRSSHQLFTERPAGVASVLQLPRPCFQCSVGGRPTLKAGGRLSAAG